MKLTLKSNFLWTLLGNVIFAASQWGVLISIARLTDATTVGLFALGLALTAPVLVFSNMNLRAVQATDSKNEFTFSDYFTLRLITSSAAFLLLLVIIFSLNETFHSQLIIIAVGLLKLIESFSDIAYGFFQKNERMNRIAISMIIRGISGLLLLSVTLYISRDIILAILIMGVSWLITLVFFDLYSTFSLQNKLINDKTCGFSTVSFFISKSYISQKRLLTISLPLAVVMVITTLNTSIPRYMIEYFHGPKELGIFSVMAYFIVVGNTLVLALGQATIPRLAHHYASHQISRFYSIIKKLIVIGLVLGISGIAIVAVAGQKILLVFYGEEFAQSPLIFTLLMIVAAITYLGDLLGVALTAMRKFRTAIPIHACSLFIMMIGAFAFIKPFGSTGAAYTMLLASCVSTMLFFGAVFYNEKFENLIFRKP